MTQELKRNITLNPNLSYDIVVSVKREGGSFSHNKKLLEDYTSRDDIYVVQSMPVMPQMQLAMTGNQVLDLANQPYVKRISINLD